MYFYIENLAQRINQKRQEALGKLPVLVGRRQQHPLPNEHITAELQRHQLGYRNFDRSGVAARLHTAAAASVSRLHPELAVAVREFRSYAFQRQSVLLAAVDQHWKFADCFLSFVFGTLLELEVLRAGTVTVASVDGALECWQLLRCWSSAMHTT